MPIYEYKCKKCGYRFEVRQGFDDDPIIECRNNGCPGPVRRVLSAPAIIFKGSGFHVNDYGRSGARPPPEKPSDGSPPAEKADAKDETD